MRDAEQFSIQPWGGLKQIGMNVMVYRFGDRVVPVDAGILFADPNDFGIEAVIPDLRPLIQKEKPNLWLITHGHEDHIGALPIILNLYIELGVDLPRILVPPFAFELVKERIRSYSGSKSKRLWDLAEPHIECIFPGHEIPIDTQLTIKYFPVRHSIPSACGVGFQWQSPRGKTLRVIHSADFKIDCGVFPDGVIEPSSFLALGEAPDFFLVDSTNADRPGRSASELDLAKGLEQVIREEDGRIFLTLFSSNVFRLSQVLHLAKLCDRRVHVAGRSLQTALRVAAESGVLRSECVEFDPESLCSIEELARLPRSRQLIVCSGSQGEPRSVLSQMGFGRHHQLQIDPGDAVVFSSKLIPGNERGVYRLINDLLRQGARVRLAEEVKEDSGLAIHASGHPREQELRDVYRVLKPKSVIPIHGGLKQLFANRDIALDEGKNWGLNPSQVHVIENGSELVFQATDGPSTHHWELMDRVDHELGQILRFEHFYAPSKEDFLKQRKRGARGGFVSVAISQNGKWTWDRGGVWIDPKNLGAIERTLADWVQTKISWLKQSHAFDPDPKNNFFQKELADSLSNRLADHFGSKPLVHVHLIG